MGQPHVRLVGESGSEGGRLLERRILWMCGRWVCCQRRGRATAVLCECWLHVGIRGCEVVETSACIPMIGGVDCSALGSGPVGGGSWRVGEVDADGGFVTCERFEKRE
jgi:hypothetical protein